MKIDIVSREVIKPSIPTPHHLRDFKLSFLDQLIPPVYVPIILFYSHNETTNLKQPAEISYLLKKSLSHTLTRFYPLAGRMRGDNLVDCNDQGVDYLEAHVDGQLSDIMKKPEVEVLNQFIPFKNNSAKLSMEQQLAIQVNFFACGGIAIGICISHRIADGLTLSTFIKGWAATARGGETNLVSPSFDSASLFPPRDLSRPRPAAPTPKERLVTRRFVFEASAIAALKAQVSFGSCLLKPTRVEVVSALIWKCAMPQIAAHSVNLRGRISPPLPEHSFGNLFQMSITAAYGQPELASLVDQLRLAIKKIDNDYVRQLQTGDGHAVVMKSDDHFKNLGEAFSRGEVQFLRFSSWCRFPIYKADFGWGKPIWVSSAGMIFKNVIFLLDPKEGDGIEAWTVYIQRQGYDDSMKAAFAAAADGGVVAAARVVVASSSWLLPP
ncbi:hypothetical protein F0562_024367 [Nyssa sinensis]|uniref:Uncharacterized protein n=1 Tax=Nyssa sinensis TaxID=561372 RepID=A0A5J5BDI0_9ASTE|nr:hypothetical protein F0562_024367 [Nyssa sinensis]